MSPIKFISLLIVLSIFSCQNPNNSGEHSILNKNEQKQKSLWVEIHKQKLQVKNGDLITRAGIDAISASLRNFNKKDKSYSHSGIALIENDGVFVYHTLAGEENPSDKMIREPFDSFCIPHNKLGIGIFRYSLNDAEIKQLDSSFKKYYQQELKFDKVFDLKDDSAMYCAEIIYKCLKRITNNRIILPTTKAQNVRIKNPAFKNKLYKEIEYVAVDNLYLNPFCREIARISYE
jgi:hypothetical protein